MYSSIFAFRLFNGFFLSSYVLLLQRGSLESLDRTHNSRRLQLALSKAAVFLESAAPWPKGLGLGSSLIWVEVESCSHSIDLTSAGRPSLSVCSLVTFASVPSWFTRTWWIPSSARSILFPRSVQRSNNCWDVLFALVHRFLHVCLKLLHHSLHLVQDASI